MTDTYRTSLRIDAPPDVVFDHFVRPELLVTWMGEYARLEAKDGGLFSVDINGVLIRGTFTKLDKPNLIEIAWGEAGNTGMPPGATRLTISLRASGQGTELELTHAGLTGIEAAKHATGWPHFLARLALAAAGEGPGPDPWAAAPPAH